MKAVTTSDITLQKTPKYGKTTVDVPIRKGMKVKILRWEGKRLWVRRGTAQGYVRNTDVTVEKRFELPEMLLEELRQIVPKREVKSEDWFCRVSNDNVLKDKMKNQQGEVTRIDKTTDAEKRFFNLVPWLHKARFFALCLSGGGIRSATFNLGVLQGLAANGVLKEIDYLSTVSGGGYIGSWLSSWMSREEGNHSKNKETVVEKLTETGHDTATTEPYQVRFLRDYSNYLTPRVGIFSIDTWAIVGTYMRNLLLNWLVLIPLLFAFAFVPRLLIRFVAGAELYNYPYTEVAILAVGVVFGLFPIAYTVLDLPTIGNMKLKKSMFVTFFLVPLLIMSCSLAAYWGCYALTDCNPPPWWVFTGLGFVIHAGGAALGMLLLPLFAKSPRVLERKEKGTWQPPSVSRKVIFFILAVITGMVAGGIGWVEAVKILPSLMEKTTYPHLLYATLSAPLIMVDYLLTGALMVAFLSKCTGEQDREWWGRSGGILILASLAWVTAMVCVIYGPWLILPNGTTFWKNIYSAVGAGAGIAAAIAGWKASTPALRPGASMSALRTTLPAFGSAVFLLFLVQLLSLSATVLLFVMRSKIFLPPHLPPRMYAPNGLDFQTHLYLLYSCGWDCLIYLLLASSLVAAITGFFVNVNTFSMHAMYRNRLIRCYLGASREREQREPNPFTGFDKEDDRLMTDLCKRPLHVVNMTWNLVKGKRLAWQQRKAASFTMSPLFAGADVLVDPSNRRAPWKKEKKKEKEPGGFRYIGEYGAGRKFEVFNKIRPPQPMHIGTAMAISGAAASPNMGYHSSPLVTFVMALFNVRLGWWLGNTGKEMGNAWRGASPWFAVFPLLWETFGQTEEKSRSVYLSDGGHFENLALYEMVRRRCRYIIACDAGCDCDTAFEDLGNAIRKVRADFGIEIDIDYHAILAKKAHFAVGRINYSCCDQREKGPEVKDGYLLYIKPVLTGDEPADIFNYAKTHAEFPHEATSDQWFDEAQFESYRKLGRHAIADLIDGEDMSVGEFFARAERKQRRAQGKLDEKEKEARPVPVPAS